MSIALGFKHTPINLVLTGSITSSVLESDISSGGETIILTLSGDTWLAAGASFDGVRQAIINGITSSQSENLGWNLEVRDKEAVLSVVRTSDTVVTITLSAATLYDITAQETITVTVPGSALATSTSDLIASSSFTVDFVSGILLSQFYYQKLLSGI